MSPSTNFFLRKALLLVTALFSASLLWAQASGISGRVLDEHPKFKNKKKAGKILLSEDCY